jgi:NAD(P)-dependent dehydrogenase (short-subunit alcohol dehydrogenase family)
VTFRGELLRGRRVATAGQGAGAIAAGLERLGAWVDSLDDTLILTGDQAADWVRERAPLHGLVFDGRASFGAGDDAGLQATLELAWLATRAVATGALIPGQGEGRLLLIAPRPNAGVYADAARAGLENLARTLSVEWARFSVTPVAVCPGVRTTDDELAELVCFMLSPAGGYYSGCRFDLGIAQDAPARAGQS